MSTNHSVRTLTVRLALIEMHNKAKPLLLTAFVIDDNVHIIVRDFNHASILSLTVFGLSDLSVSPTRGKSTLDRIISNHPQFFCLKLRVPI